MRITLETISQLKFRRNLLIIGTLSLVSTLLWMSYSLYDVYRKDDTDPEIQQYLEPLNPSLDLDTLNSLQDRYMPPSDFTILAREADANGTSQRQITITRDSYNTASVSATKAPTSTLPTINEGTEQ